MLTSVSSTASHVLKKLSEASKEIKIWPQIPDLATQILMQALVAGTLKEPEDTGGKSHFSQGMLWLLMPSCLSSVIEGKGEKHAISSALLIAAAQVIINTLVYSLFQAFPFRFPVLNAEDTNELISHRSEQDQVWWEGASYFYYMPLASVLLFIALALDECLKKEEKPMPGAADTEKLRLEFDNSFSKKEKGLEDQNSALMEASLASPCSSSCSQWLSNIGSGLLELGKYLAVLAAIDAFCILLQSIDHELVAKAMDSRRPIDFANFTARPDLETLDFYKTAKVLSLGTIDSCKNKNTLEGNFYSGHTCVVWLAAWYFLNIARDRVKKGEFGANRNTGLIVVLSVIALGGAAFTSSSRVLADCHSVAAVSAGSLQASVYARLLKNFMNVFSPDGDPVQAFSVTLKKSPEAVRGVVEKASRYLSSCCFYGEAEDGTRKPLLSDVGEDVRFSSSGRAQSNNNHH